MHCYVCVGATFDDFYCKTQAGAAQNRVLRQSFVSVLRFFRESSQFGCELCFVEFDCKFCANPNPITVSIVYRSSHTRAPNIMLNYSRYARNASSRFPVPRSQTIWHNKIDFKSFGAHDGNPLHNHVNVCTIIVVIIIVIGAASGVAASAK